MDFERWTFERNPVGKNLTDKLIATGGASLGQGSLIAYEAPPRTYGLTVGVKF